MQRSTQGKKKIAFWFRYSPADHAELFPAIGALIEELSATCDIHYFGLRGSRPCPEAISQHSTVHLIPVNIRRSSTADKVLKLFVWYALLPFIALRCRSMKIDAVCINDYMPLSAFIAQKGAGATVIMWIADFLHSVYSRKLRILRPLARIIDTIDFASWRKCPLIFTLAETTRSFLVRRGIPADRVIAVPDPCDTTVYRPLPKKSCRDRWGYTDAHIVLAHHGVLHPNKGIDRILEGIAPLMHSEAQLRFLLIGSGPELHRLRDLATSLDIDDKVQFTGWMKTTTEVNEAINAGDIGLVMRTGTESDNFHTTSALVHNMCAGLPILSARLGGVSEIIQDGQNGSLFDPGDMQEFRSKLQILIGNKEKRTHLGASALKLAQQLFAIESVVTRTATPILAILEPE